jgi:glycosyltransferase involved in cell wall biosynthesis
MKKIKDRDMKFTIVTPSYNQGKFIQDTIESVLSQNGVDLEYIIIDGGSNDNSVDVIKKYAPRITYWESIPDKGQTNAINNGFARATGDILGWLNSDDVLTSGALSLVKDSFKANPQSDVVYGDSSYMTSDGIVFRTKKSQSFSIEDLRKFDFLYQPSTFFSRRVFDEVGPLDEDYQSCMDYEYWLRLAEHGARFVYEPSLLSQMRFHDDAKSVSGILLSLEEEKNLKLNFGYPYSQVQYNYLYKKYYARFIWPLKRSIAFYLHKKGFSL